MPWSGTLGEARVGDGSVRRIGEAMFGDVGYPLFLDFLVDDTDRARR